LINQQPNSSSPVTEFLIPYANSGPNAIVSAPNHILWFVEYNTSAIGEFNESSKHSTNSRYLRQGELYLHRSPWTVWAESGLPIRQEQPQCLGPQCNRLTCNIPPILDEYANFDPRLRPSRQCYRRCMVHRHNRQQHWKDRPSNGPDYEVSSSHFELGPAELALQNGTSYLWVTESFVNKVARFDMSSNTFQEFTPPVSLVSPVG